MQSMQFPTFDDKLEPGQQFLEVDPTLPIRFRISKRKTSAEVNGEKANGTAEETGFDRLMMNGLKAVFAGFY